MLSLPQLNSQSSAPLYRQLYSHLREAIERGSLRDGDRLPATREMAEKLGVNRTTISTAYAMLESEGWIKGQVGRGSFVSNPLDPSNLAGHGASTGTEPNELISFATSRPASELFPIDLIRSVTDRVLAEQGASILQLGSPSGYAPLRDHILAAVRREGVATEDSAVLMTSGCQQALDLVARALTMPGDTVFIEDPVYPGLREVFARAGVQTTGIPVGAEGLDLRALEKALTDHRPRLLVVTPSFQNPTGISIPEAARSALFDLCASAGVPIVENDIYSLLRYQGPPLEPLARLEPRRVILLRSYSKIGFPGLRVGWISAERPIIDRLTEAKQWADLHSDQLSQAIMLEFERSGGLSGHLRTIRAAFHERLTATLRALQEFMPDYCGWTVPEGGMSLWLRLPESVDAGALLPLAQRAGVDYLPGRFFAVNRMEPSALRLSFAGVPPRSIRRGIEILSQVLREELASAPGRSSNAVAMV